MPKICKFYGHHCKFGSHMPTLHFLESINLLISNSPCMDLCAQKAGNLLAKNLNGICWHTLAKPGVSPHLLWLWMADVGPLGSRKNKPLLLADGNDTVSGPFLHSVALWVAGGHIPHPNITFLKDKKHSWTGCGHGSESACIPTICESSRN